ncbi:MAG TPA: DEAD/DEAH box helicase [Chthonomonadales bacterium]|nr:DEAD/DEAH box helicase [Chthonomonadales bacterium]
MPSFSRRTPRAWQVRALAQWRACGRRGIVRVVTGAGKTVLAQMCIADYLSESPAGRVVVVVPTLALLDQWWVSLREDCFARDDDIATYSGESRAERPATVNIVVLNTARDWVARVMPGHDGLLVVDECHRAGSGVNSRAVAGHLGPALGLSATPERQHDHGLDDVLVPALGPLIYEYDYNEAARDGVISAFELCNIRVETGPSEAHLADALADRVLAAQGLAVGARGTSWCRSLRRRTHLSVAGELRLAVVGAVIDRHRGARTLVFHERIGDAERVLALLKERGHSATLYHSRMSPVLRRDNLRLYRRGAFDVLVTCRALDEGVDVPDTRIALIAASTSSVRQRIQRMGRALRPSAGKDVASVITLYATAEEETRLRREAARLREAERVTWHVARVSQ